LQPRSESPVRRREENHSRCPGHLQFG
jgi:hypothetical protein